MLLKSFFNISIKILGTGFAFLFVWIIGGSLPPEEAGNVFTFMALSLLLSTMTRLGTDFSVVRYASINKMTWCVNNSKNLTLLIFFIFFISVLLLFGVLLTAKFWIFVFDGASNNINNLSIILISFPFLAVCSLAIAVLNGFERNLMATWLLTGMSPIVSVFIYYVFILFDIIKDPVELVCISYSLGQVLTSFVSLVLVRSILSLSKFSSYLYWDYNLLRDGFRLYPGAIADQFINNLPLLIAGVIFNSGAVAVFAISLRISNSIFFIFSSINAIVSPVLARLHANFDFLNFHKEIRKTRRIMCLTMVPICIIVAILSKYLLAFFDEYYAEQNSILLLLLIGQIIHAYFGPVLSALMMSGSASEYRKSMYIGAVTSILFVYVLGLILGLIGAALGVVVGVFVQKLTAKKYVNLLGT